MARKLGMLLMVGAALGLAACSEESVRKDAVEATTVSRKGPEQAPARAITNFSQALRCMDNLFLMYGVRDLVVISEDLADQTKKVSAGTKDMLISSVSQMTTRSKAVRLIAYGSDSNNLISFMKEAEKKTMFQLIPQYGIRGSISQLDESVGKKTEGAGVSLGFAGVGKASMASTNVMALDLTMMRTEDLSIVPGVTASNQVVILRSGSGIEGEAEYKKFGVNYSSNLSRQEGSSQALRNLVELAVVELFGKLTKVPYWMCLNATTQDESVKSEIGDWFQGMFAEPGEFVTYWQQQMRIRGVFSGEVNGEPDEGLRDAVTAYREALGMEKNAKLDLDFFTRYLGANHYETSPKAKQFLASYPTRAAVEVAKAATDPTPIQMTVTSTKGGNQFRKGERLFVNVQPSRDAFVYCFMQDENKQIARFFPNRFAQDALVKAQKGIQLPSNNKFNIDVNTKGLQEQIVCYGANRDVFSDVVPSIGGGDIDTPVQVKTLAELEAVFKKAAGPTLGVGNFTVNVR